jgi:Tfp pilus assembly protein FimV
MQSFGSQISDPSDSTIGWLTDSLIHLSAGTQPDIAFCANRFFGPAHALRDTDSLDSWGHDDPDDDMPSLHGPCADAVDEDSSDDMPALIRRPVGPSADNDSSDSDDDTPPSICASINASPILVDYSNGSVCRRRPIQTIPRSTR